MSFGAGMGAGMGAGIGAGIAIGIGSGQKRAQDQIREYLVTHELTIHDATGKEVSIETLLSEATATGECSNKGWVAVAIIIALLVGIALFAVLAYFVLSN